jgi:site-specific DNA-cytosine methylase
MDRLEAAVKAEFGPSFDALPRNLVCAEPCHALGGASRFAVVAGGQFVSVHVMDTNGRLRGFFEEVSKVCGVSINLNEAVFGDAGDVLTFDVSKLKMGDILVAGPPCTPWAKGGGRQGTDNPASLVFQMLLEWVILLCHRGCLLAFALENSPETATLSSDGKPPFLMDAVSKLAREVPYMVVDVVFSELNAFLPLNRRRSWLRGMRYDAAGKAIDLPPPVKSFGGRPVLLEELIGNNEAGKADLSKLTPQRKQNFEWYVERIRGDVASGKAGAIAVMDIDRGAGKVFGPVLAYDVIPGLRTRGPHYLLISTEDIGEDEPEKKKVCRFLSVAERFQLLGYPAAFSEAAGRNLAHQLTGNAFAIPMVASVVGPMVKEIARNDMVQTSGISPLSIKGLFALAAEATASRKRRRAGGAAAALELEGLGPGPNRVLRRHQTI